IFYALRQSSLSSGPVWTFQVGTSESTAPNDPCLSAAVWDPGAHRLIIGGERPTTPIDGSSPRGSIRAISPDATPSKRVIWDKGLPCAVYGTPSENAAGVVAVATYNRCASGSSPALYLFNARRTMLNLLGNPDPVQLKTFALPAGAFSQPVFADGYLFVASNNQLTA